MTDIYHYYGGDLGASPSGDLLLADKTTTGTQRVYRRLLTNPQLNDAAGNPIASPDYTWNPTFGAGLPRKVGSPGNSAATKALIKGQMFMESAVVRQPPPTINVLQQNDVSGVTIQYIDANTATPQLVTFDIGI